MASGNGTGSGAGGSVDILPSSGCLVVCVTPFGAGPIAWSRAKLELPDTFRRDRILPVDPAKIMLSIIVITPLMSSIWFLVPM